MASLHRRSKHLAAIAGALAGLPLLVGSAQAKDCQRSDAASQARRFDQTVCGKASDQPRRPDDRERLKADRRPGFIDLGGGAEIRVGGRVRLDVDHSR